MANQTEAEIVRDLAYQAVRPALLERGNQYAWITRDGALVEADLSDKMPAMKDGTVIVRDVESFGVYYDKHADDDSEVFADLDAGTITAVLDAHHSADWAARGLTLDDARWQQHRLVLALKPTLPWVTWTAQNRKPMTQIDFADFLEDNRRDLDPDGGITAADFLELAQSSRPLPSWISPARSGLPTARSSSSTRRRPTPGRQVEAHRDPNRVHPRHQAVRGLRHRADPRTVPLPGQRHHGHVPVRARQPAAARAGRRQGDRRQGRRPDRRQAGHARHPVLTLPNTWPRPDSCRRPPNPRTHPHPTEESQMSKPATPAPPRLARPGQQTRTSAGSASRSAALCATTP